MTKPSRYSYTAPPDAPLGQRRAPHSNVRNTPVRNTFPIGGLFFRLTVGNGAPLEWPRSAAWHPTVAVLFPGTRLARLAPNLTARRMAVSIIITSPISTSVLSDNPAHKVFDFGAQVARLVRPQQMAGGEDQQTEAGTAQATKSRSWVGVLKSSCPHLRVKFSAVPALTCRGFCS